MLTRLLELTWISLGCSFGIQLRLLFAYTLSFLLLIVYSLDDGYAFDVVMFYRDHALQLSIAISCRDFSSQIIIATMYLTSCLLSQVLEKQRGVLPYKCPLSVYRETCC